MNNNRPFAHRSCASPGIDKLMLTTQSFIIKDASKTGLQVKHGFTDLATGEQNNPYLFTDRTGRKVQGISAFINKEEQYQVDINQYGLRVIFNPSKAYHPYELCRNTSTLQERIETVSKELHSKGIRFDIDDAKVARIDLATNALMDHPCIAYSDLFSWLNISRAKQNVLYPDGHSSHNKQFGSIFYNKGKELLKSGIKLIDHDNLMRGELQYKTPQSVCKRTGITTVSSLYDIGINNLATLYKETMSTDIFKAGQSNQLRIEYTTTKEFLIALKKAYGGNALNIFYNAYGVQNLVDSIGSIDAYRTLLQELGYHRNTVGKHTKKVMKLLNIQKQLISNNTGISKLYKELYYKFAS